MHGIVQSLTCQDGARCGEEQDTCHDCYGQNEDGAPVLPYDLRIDHHAHRHEENCSEQVLYALDKMHYMFAFQRLGQDGAHDKSAKSCRKAGKFGQGDHYETQAQADQQQNLIIKIFARLLEQRRNKVYANQEPQYKEEHQYAHIKETP